MSVFLFSHSSQYPSGTAAAVVASVAAESLDSSAAGGSSSVKQEKRLNPKIDFELFKTYALYRSTRQEEKAQTIFDRLVSETDPESMQGFLKLIPSKLLEKSPKVNEAAAGGAATLSAEQQKGLCKKAEKVANQLLKLACESPQFFTYTPYVLDKERMIIRDAFTFIRYNNFLDADPVELSIVRASGNRHFVISCVDPLKLQIEIKHDKIGGDYFIGRLNPGELNEIIRTIPLYPQNTSPRDVSLFFIPKADSTTILGYKGFSDHLYCVQISDKETIPCNILMNDGRLTTIPSTITLCKDSSSRNSESYYESCFPKISAIETLQIFDGTQLYRTKEENSLFCFINLQGSFSKETLIHFLQRAFGANHDFLQEIPLCTSVSTLHRPPHMTNWKLAIYSPDGKRFFVIDTQETTTDRNGNTMIELPLDYTGRMDLFTESENSEDSSGAGGAGQSEPTQADVSKKILLDGTTATYLENEQIIRTFSRVKKEAVPQFYLDWVDGKKHLKSQKDCNSKITLAHVHQEDLRDPTAIVEAVTDDRGNPVIPPPIANLIFQYSQEGVPFIAGHDFSEYVKMSSRAPIASQSVASMADIDSASGAKAGAAPAPAPAPTAAEAAAAAAAGTVAIAAPERRAPKRPFHEISRPSDGSGSSSSDSSGSSSQAPKRVKHEQ